jgi:hypothetical protein
MVYFVEENGIGKQIHTSSGGEFIKRGKKDGRNEETKATE